MQLLEQGSPVKRNPSAKVPVDFKLKAPQAKEVRVAGDFTKWGATPCPLKRNRDGIWETRLLLMPGKYQYKFLVDGKWQNDPACQECVPNPFGTANNVVKAK